MANTYRSNGFTEYPRNPGNSVGKAHRSVFFEKTITAAAATTNDLYILSGPMTFDDKIAAVLGATPALTSAADCDLGFYSSPDGGTTFVALDADILWDGITLASALTYRELLGTLNTALDRDDNIGTLLGMGSDQEPWGGVYLGLLLKTASTAVSETLKLEVLIEEATTK